MKRGNTDPYQDFSSFYDIYVGDWLADLPLYLEYAKKSPGPVLEVGAGSGRLTIPLAQEGFSVTAVDISPSMLAILESRLTSQTDDVRRRVQVVLSDARELDLSTDYGLIIVPFYTFNYLLSPEDQDVALRSMSKHLSNRGRLLIDVFIPLKRIDLCPREPVLRVDLTDPRTGNRIRGWNIYEMDRQGQVEYRKHVFEVAQSDGSIVKKEFATQRHYSFPEQLEQVFAHAGLHVEDVFSGYGKDRPTPTSEQLLYVLTKDWS